MASQSSQESVTSRRGKATTIIPERSRAHPRRRPAKRETTLRAFTIVRDWEPRQSPLALIHGQSGDKPNDVTGSSSRSSVTISPSPQIITQAASLSSSGRPRVSPGPIIIASPSSRKRTGSSKKKQSAYNASASLLSTRHGPDVISEQDPETNQSGDATADSVPDVSGLPTPSEPSTTPIQASGDTSRQNEDSTLQSPDQVPRSADKSSSVVADGHDRVTGITASTAAPDNNESVASSPGQSQDASSGQSVAIHSPDKRPFDTPRVNWRNDHSQFVTPGQQSMSIIAKTPKSGPVNRNVVSRRQKLSSPSEGNFQQPVKIASGSKKAKVRLWAGNGRRRLATDVTDLDMVLSTLEDVTMDYKQKLESSSQRRALMKFFHVTKKELTDKIDLSQECKVLKSALVRMTTMTRKQRKKLLSLQQENARLNSRIRELKNNATNKKHKSHELNDISSFLGDLQDFHHDHVEPIDGDEDAAIMDFSSQNIGPLLASTKASSKSLDNLRSLNDQLQKWLTAH